MNHKYENMARIGEGGRIVIPAEYRKALELKTGDEVLLLLDDGEIRILTPQRAIERAQALVRRYIPKGRNLTEELLQERREETGRA